ncbi:MAG: DUF3786 domain-containing protein [Candidatus Omnitrophica bacterium]|nr:DUF3786 domain-containing protein [Candidatus Omnitrophota bacterium]MCM8828845.1 DUF3786 domain-containing protein [Candidatus Omnitrophota bacterium]
MDAIELAIQKLKSIAPEEIERNSGCEWNQRQKIITVPFLNMQCNISISNFSFLESFINTKEKILIFHYLVRSKDSIAETGSLISFSELEAGNIYRPSIESRVYKPLLDKFGSSGEEFLKKAFFLGAQKTEMSEFSVKIKVFPKVCIYIVLYPADEEFPASCQILFDSSISQIFETEDIVVMCEEIAERLIS